MYNNNNNNYDNNIYNNNNNNDNDNNVNILTQSIIFNNIKQIQIHQVKKEELLKQY